MGGSDGGCCRATLYGKTCTLMHAITEVSRTGAYEFVKKLILVILFFPSKRKKGDIRRTVVKREGVVK